MFFWMLNPNYRLERCSGGKNKAQWIFKYFKDPLTLYHIQLVSENFLEFWYNPATVPVLNV